TLALQKSNAKIMQKAQSAHTSALAKRHSERMFKHNSESLGAVLLILFGTFVASFAVAIIGGGGVLGIIAVLVLMLLSGILFGFLVRAPTTRGRRMLDEIEGLKLYLGVAERDELAKMPGPGEPPRLDTRRYERLLPYAVALDVEDAWTKK